MVVVTSQVFFVDKQVVIFIELPELAVNNIKVLVAEVISDLIDVLLFFQQTHRRQ